MKHVLLALCLATACYGAEEKKAEPPPLPDTVKLTNGATLHKVSVIRWEKDTVVLKHDGTADPIRYDHLAPDVRPQFVAARDLALPAQAMKKKAAMIEETERQKSAASNRQTLDEIRRKIEDAILHHTLAFGMTYAEATKSWGEPRKINGAKSASGDGIVQWVYGDHPHVKYVYFRDGYLTSFEEN